MELKLKSFFKNQQNGPRDLWPLWKVDSCFFFAPSLLYWLHTPHTKPFGSLTNYRDHKISSSDYQMSLPSELAFAVLTFWRWQRCFFYETYDEPTVKYEDCSLMIIPFNDVLCSELVAQWYYGHAYT